VIFVRNTTSLRSWGRRSHVKSIIVAPKPVEEQMPGHLESISISRLSPCSGLSRRPHLRLNQHQVDEQHDKVMLDVLVGKSLASRALGQAHAFPKRPIVGIAEFLVEGRYGMPAFNANRHFSGLDDHMLIVTSKLRSGLGGCSAIEMEMWKCLEGRRKQLEIM
jgi:hypothetical protein